MTKKVNDEVMATLIAGVLGIVALLVLFSCSSISSMSCDNLLAEEKDRCLEEVKNRDNNIRYQMESRGSLR
jgi:hypothetical protein